MRVPQKQGIKGSLKWMQDVVNLFPEILNGKLQEQLPFDADTIEWVSPIESDEYAEYRDADFLERLGLQGLAGALHEFWPRSGPQWDALGKCAGADSTAYFLVEAKANIPEVLSTCQATAPASIQKIDSALHSTQNFLRCTPHIPWNVGIYQYANRIAHLYFLRQQCQVNAYLIFLYFVDDNTHIPTSYEAWQGANLLQKSLMGLRNHSLQDYVIDIYIDTQVLAEAGRP